MGYHSNPNPNPNPNPNQQVRYALYTPPVSLRARCQLRSATASVDETSATPQSNEVFHEAARPIACGKLVTRRSGK